MVVRPLLTLALLPIRPPGADPFEHGERLLAVRQRFKWVVALLGSVSRVGDRTGTRGRRLERADAAFAETGATSSARVLATGEGTVTRGTIYGLYIFRAT